MPPPPPFQQYLALSGMSQFGIAKLRFQWFTPKTVKAACAPAPSPRTVPKAMMSGALLVVERIPKLFSSRSSSGTRSQRTSGTEPLVRTPGLLWFVPETI